MADENKVIDLETLSHFKAKQDLMNEQKFKRKDDSTDLKGAVRYDAAQVLSEQEKAQARHNIGAAAPGEGGGGGGTAEGAVRHDIEQALDEDDKARARANIGTTDGTWANMPDKPFGETGYKYEWDGDTTDREVIHFAPDTAVYKVSSDILTEDELLGASFALYFDGGVRADEVTIEGTSTIGKTQKGNLVVFYMGAMPVVFVANTVGEDYYDVHGFSVPSTGTWLLRGRTDEEHTHYIQKDYETITIDKKFLPQNLVTTDKTGLIPASKLPSYVDDVVEGYYNPKSGYSNDSDFVDSNGSYLFPESGKIYVDLNTGNTYRWSGSAYVRLNPDEYTIATTSDIDALFT